MTDATVAAGMFAATNVDDLVVLVALFGDRGTRDRDVVVGQALGIGALTIASALLARVALALPDTVVALLGLAPVVLGVRLWWRRRHHSPDDDAERPGLGLRAVAAVTIANGGDNVAVYTPVLTTASLAGTVTTAVVFAVGTTVWLVAARALVRQRHVGARVASWGGRILPYVLVAIGVAVIAHHT